MSDPLKPSARLLAKLGSLVVHVEEFQSPGGHPFDAAAIRSLLDDTEVKEWTVAMGEMGFLPAKRI